MISSVSLTACHSIVMHGLIHVVLKSLVLEKFSAEAWAAILVELNIEDDA